MQGFRAYFAMLWFLIPIGPAWSDCASCTADQVHEELAAPELVREEILRTAIEKKVPVFIKKTAHGQVPVVLLNSQTVPELRPFIDDSIGIFHVMQPEAGNDHGGVRLGRKLIDVDTPGRRTFGEIHDTGISWRPLESYLDLRKPTSDVMVEIVFRLNPAEKRVAEYYQRVRRAAIFRVKFNFGTTRTVSSAENMLVNGAEHCFIFSRGAALDIHIQEMENRLRSMGVKNVEALMNHPLILRHLEMVQRRMLNTLPDQPATFNASLMMSKSESMALQSAMPPGVRVDQAMTWIVALDATRKYRVLLRDLGITTALSWQDMENPRAVAVLIYDDPSKADVFNRGHYETPGHFLNWTTENQRPVQASDLKP